MYFTVNAVKPCKVSCNSYVQDSDIHMAVSWDLCPLNDSFIGYVDKYVVQLNCTDVSWVLCT